MKGPHPWRQPGVLQELYVEQGLSIHDVSDELGCSAETVGRWLDEHGIETREPTWEKTPSEVKDGGWLYYQYVEHNKSAIQIGDELGCAATTVRSWLDKHGIQRRSRGQAIEARALHEPAKYDTSSQGYERWRVFRDGSRERVLVHRLLAISEFGYDAVVKNVVHHKNGIRWDNRPGNLEVMSAAEHGRLHAGERGESP